jgi:S-DNA-T family DNA segregation ATPase FtsK/SpoIIIE
MDACGGCGFVYETLAAQDVADALRSYGPQYRERLVGGESSALRAHPQPEVWSPLEYACHIRDVLTVQRERVGIALTEERPVVEPMRREERVIELRYNEQAPMAIADEIDRAAAALADRFESLTDDQWARTMIYNWPVETERALVWVGQHTVHECRHHLADIDAGLASATGG